MYNIPELEHCPVSHTILLAFLSSCAGAYSRSTISNFTAGIQAWHLLHGHPWVAEQYELKITCLTPRSSKQPKCPPMTLNNIKTIQTFLNLDDPCNVAIYTCMVIVFYSVARLGKFTVMAITKFDPSKHITSQNVSFLMDQGSLLVIKFTLPSTKCTPDSEDVQCVPQRGCSLNPETALQRHFHINSAPPSTHLFTWKHPKSSLCPSPKHSSY